ncbi:hypothetical protein MRX96_048947 [Rhipicephalus microplus]
MHATNHGRTIRERKKVVALLCFYYFDTIELSPEKPDPDYGMASAVLLLRKGLALFVLVYSSVRRQQQIGELRRQNQILARKIQELEAKQVGSSEPVQEAEAEDGDDGSSVTSRLTSVSRQDADTVVGPASITGSIGRIESLEHKTEQLEASVAALPTQIMSVVRESFQDMFTAALTQALPEIVAQVSNSVLKAVQPWVIAPIKNTTQSDSPQVKSKSASRQAAEEGFSGPAPGPDRTSAP